MEATPEKMTQPRGRWKTALLILVAVVCGSLAAWWFGPWSAAYRYSRMSLVSLRQTLDQRPNDALGWRTLGLRLAREGDGALAEPALIQAYALNQQDVEVATGLSEILLAEGHYPEAFELLKRAVAHNPRSVTAQMALGRLYRKKASFLHAAEAFNAVVQTDPKVPEAWYALADCYLQMQRLAQAKDAITQALLLTPAEPNYLMLKGNIEVALGDVDAGIAAVQQAAQLAPTNLKVQSNYLSVLLIHHRNNSDLDKAEEIIGTLEQINPENPMLPFEHGELERLREHWAQAARFLERGTQTAPEHDQTYYSLMQVYRHMQRTGDADRMLAIFRHRQELQRQISQLQIALEARPTDVTLYSRMADLQAQAGNMGGAVSSLKTALNIAPGEASLKAKLTRFQSQMSNGQGVAP